MTEWHEQYENATETEVIAQALDACSRKDCAHCLYQGKGIMCAQRLMLEAAQALTLSNGQSAAQASA